MLINFAMFAVKFDHHIAGDGIACVAHTVWFAHGIVDEGRGGYGLAQSFDAAFIEKNGDIVSIRMGFITLSGGNNGTMALDLAQIASLAFKALVTFPGLILCRQIGQGFRGAYKTAGKWIRFVGFIGYPFEHEINDRFIGCVAYGMAPIIRIIDEVAGSCLFGF